MANIILSEIQYKIMNMLTEKNYSVKELSVELDKPRQSIRQAYLRLEKLKFIKTFTDYVNRIPIVLTITDTGIKYLKKITGTNGTTEEVVEQKPVIENTKTVTITQPLIATLNDPSFRHQPLTAWLRALANEISRMADHLEVYDED